MANLIGKDRGHDHYGFVLKVQPSLVIPDGFVTQGANLMELSPPFARVPDNLQSAFPPVRVCPHAHTLGQRRHGIRHKRRSRYCCTSSESVGGSCRNNRNQRKDARSAKDYSFGCASSVSQCGCRARRLFHLARSSGVEDS